jgi:hypothetical protein
MDFLRRYWFDAGLLLAFLSIIYVSINHSHLLSLLLWLNLIALFLHQFEEYQFPGGFPRMMNQVMFSSDQPDRFPLNSNSALIINLGVGWLIYFLAALFGEKLIWLGMAAILVSAGNFIAHTFLFTIKGKMHYSPGMATSIFLFLPISVYFFYILILGNLASPLEWVLGIVLGIALNYIGILKMIDWLKDKNSPYVFQNGLPK